MKWPILSRSSIHVYQSQILINTKEATPHSYFPICLLDNFNQKSVTEPTALFKVGGWRGKKNNGAMKSKSL